MSQRIRRDIDRPSKGHIEFFAEQTAADVHEAMGKSGAMDAEVGPVAGNPSVCGPAITARVPSGDNTMVHVAAKVATKGDVLVFGSDNTETATWGELATRNAVRKELSGVISDGNVRDVSAIDELGFPVFSRAVSQKGARKAGQGSINVPVSVGGVVVNPGDIIVGDPDGVTVVPQEMAGEVRYATEQKRRDEDKIRERIADGESLYDLIGIEEVLEARE
jgi:4-hydroxy-4-methyl-2-oxoglutarate aldolase